MAPSTSPFARGKSLRLARTRSNNEGTAAHPLPSPPDTAAPLIRTSFSDLKNRPDARAGLRRQFSSTFLDTAGETLEEEEEEEESGPSPEASLRGRLPRSKTAPTLSQDAHLRSAPSNPIIIEPNKLSVVPESTQLDVEQAISLLEQLKKTASPEQLVALHRALLPTKDVITPVTPMFPSLDDDSGSAAAPPMRKSALFTPGLATRGGAEEDVLRKPSDFFLKPVPASARKRERASARPVEKPLAPPSPPRLMRFPSAARSETPDLVYSHPGAFQHGTLRIMNGAASPEPSLYTRDSIEAPREQIIARQTQVLHAKAQSRSNIDVQELQRAQNHAVPAHHPKTPSQDSSRDRSRSVARTLPDPAQEDVDPGSPCDAESEDPCDPEPHRASHLSQEYLTHCEINSSPYASQKIRRQDSRELPIAKNVDATMDADFNQDAREDALSKLTGDPNPPTTRSRKSVSHVALVQEPKSLITQTKQISNLDTYRKVDSGYSSDVSHRTGEQDTPIDDTRRESQMKLDPRQSGLASDPTKLGSVLAAQERHSFKEFLSSPIYATTDVSEASHGAVYAHGAIPSQVFESHANRNTIESSRDVAHRHPPSFDSPSPAQTLPATPSDATIGKQRKLKKPMPASVRQQREQDGEASSKASKESTPTVPPTTSQRFAQSEESLRLSPLAAAFPLTPGTASTKLREEEREQLDKEGSDTARRSVGKRSKSRGRSGTEARRQSSKDAPVSANSSSGLFARLRSKSRGRQSTRNVDIDAANAALEGQPWNSEVKGGTIPYRVEDVQPLKDVVNGARTRLGSEPFITPPELVRANNSVPDLRVHDGSRSKSAYIVDEAIAAEVRKSFEMSNRNEGLGARPRTAGSRIGDRPNSSKSGVQMRRPGHDFAGWQRDDEPPMPPSHRHRPRTSHAEDVSSTLLPDAKGGSVDDGTDESQDRSRTGSVNSSSTRSQRLSKEEFQSLKVLQAKQMLQARKEEQARRREERLRIALETSADAAELLLDETRSPRWSLDKSIQLPFPDASPQIESPTHDSQHPGWPGWEKQVKLWRQRNLERLGALPTPDGQSYSEGKSRTRGPQPSRAVLPESPEVVMARNISPYGPDLNSVRAKINANAAFGRPLTAPIYDDRDARPPRPDIIRANSAFTAATNFGAIPTADDQSAKRNLPRMDSAHSSVHSTEATPTTPSSGGSGPSAGGPRAYPPTRPAHMSSTKPVPFRPIRQSERPPPPSYPPPEPTTSPGENAAQYERFRAKIAAKNVSAAQMIRAPSPRRPDALETPKQAPARKAESEAIVDRYSNGFGYGWAKDEGFSGSAGTRTTGDASSPNRKSLKTSRDLGLDLSDVPVFLRKVN